MKYIASIIGVGVLFLSLFVLTAKAFLDRNPNPSKAEVRDVMMSNLCRCTGYEKIIEAIMAVANGEVA